MPDTHYDYLKPILGDELFAQFAEKMAHAQAEPRAAGLRGPASRHAPWLGAAQAGQPGFRGELLPVRGAPAEGDYVTWRLMNDRAGRAPALTC